jgi:hypothetical protein
MLKWWTAVHNAMVKNYQGGLETATRDKGLCDSLSGEYSRCKSLVHLPASHETLQQQVQTSDRNLLLAEKHGVNGKGKPSITRDGYIPNAKMLFCRKDSKSARGVAGVMRVYGCDASRWNFVIYMETLSFWTKVNIRGEKGKLDKMERTGSAFPASHLVFRAATSM